jgi:RNA polymerase sigma factor (sigma-70 family)
MSPTPVARLASACTAAPAADTDLLAKYAADRDDAAFAVLVRRHGPMVRAVARRAVRDRHLADDVAQAVFLVLARKAGRLARPDRLAGWLFGVARRLAARAVARRPAVVHCPLTHVPAASEPAPGWDELLAVLDAELAKLPEGERAALVLCYLEGRTRDEAARACGWSVRTLRRRLADGRVRLRSRLARRGLDLGATLVGLALSRDGLNAGLQPLVEVAAPPARAGVEALACTELRPRWLAGLAVAVGAVALVAVAADFPWRPQGPPPATDPPKATPPAPATAAADLPAGALALLGSPDLRHPDYLSDLRFSPDGRELISYGHGRVRRWDARTGASVRPPDPPADVRTTHADMRLTAELKRVVGPYVEHNPVRYSIREYDLATGRHRVVVALPLRMGPDGQAVDPTRFATSPDGSLLAEVSGDDIYLWDLKTAKVRHQIKPPGDRTVHVTFTPDGAFLVTAGVNTMAVRLWDVASGREAEKLTRDGTKAGVSSLAVSPDGRWVVAAENIHRLGVGTEVAVWDRTAHGPPRVLTLPDGLGPGSTLAFAPDAPTLYFVTGGRPRSVVTVWDVAAWKRVNRWEVGPADGWSVRAAVAPHGGPLAVGWQFGVIHLYDIKTGAELVAPAGHPDTVAAAAFTPDGVRTVGADGSSATWDAKTGALQRRKDLPAADRRGDKLAAVAATPDGRLLLTRVENRAGLGVDPPFILTLWDAARAERKHEWVVDAFTTAVGLTPDGVYAVAQVEKDGFRVFATTDGREVARVVRPHKAWRLRFALPADGKTLVVCDDEAADAFDLATGKRRFGWKLADQRVLAGIEAAAHNGGAHIRAIAAGPAGKTLVLSVGGPAYRDRAKRVDSLVLVEAETGAVIRRARVPDGAPAVLAVSPDGRWVAGGGAIWDGATLTEVRRFPDWPRVSAAGFRLDGRRLVTGRDDGTSMVWRVGE